MRQTLNLLLFALLISAVLPSCVSKKKFTELQSEKDALAQSLAATQEKVKMLETNVSDLEASLESEKNRLNGEISKLQSDLASAKTDADNAKKMAADKEAQLKKLQTEVDGVFAAYNNSGLTVNVEDGKLMIATSEPINYRSGSARVRGTQLEAVKALAGILKNNPDVKVLIEGHTDNAKMVQGARYADNWDLSLARAANVVRKLIKEGVNPAQLSAAGKGEYIPATSGDQDSKEVRTKNRRTEVLATPSVGSLFKKD